MSLAASLERSSEIAALAMSMSSVSVVGNALRLRRLRL
jgi:cation transport ATPase